MRRTSTFHLLTGCGLIALLTACSSKEPGTETGARNISDSTMASATDPSSGPVAVTTASEEARALYAQLRKDGWVDALEKWFDGQPPYTFWPYWRRSFERDAGIRIDHALLNKKAASKLEAGGVDRDARGWDSTSDHAPIWIELDD